MKIYPKMDIKVRQWIGTAGGPEVTLVRGTAAFFKSTLMLYSAR
jgi:hypothetical protein